MPLFRWFAEPSGHRLTLDEAPRLDSWNKQTHPQQIALSAYVDHVEALLADQLRISEDPLTLALHVGLDQAVPLLKHRDLDNYLLPIARRLRSDGRHLASAHATKSHAGPSTVAVGPAAASPVALTEMCTVHIDTSYEHEGYKQTIRDAIADLDPLPDEGPVGVELSFAVGQNRNWLALWKPTIDALGHLLGHDPGAGEWDARDGRITRLALHCTVEARTSWDVDVAIAATSLITTPNLDDELAMIAYALSFDGYAHTEIQQLAQVADSVARTWKRTQLLPNSTDDLRRTLFFLQRQHRATEDPDSFGSLPLVAAIVGELRRRAPGGLVNHPVNL